MNMDDYTNSLVGCLVQPPQSFGLSNQISTHQMLCSFHHTNFAGTGACSKTYLFRKGASREVTTP